MRNRVSREVNGPKNEEASSNGKSAQQFGSVKFKDEPLALRIGQRGPKSGVGGVKVSHGVFVIRMSGQRKGNRRQQEAAKLKTRRFHTQETFTKPQYGAESAPSQSTNVFRHARKFFLAKPELSVIIEN